VTELEALAAALAAHPGSVLATLVEVDGSAYRGAGARMVIHPDGTTFGAISGGCLEKDLLAHAEQVRAGRTAKTVTWDLTRDDDAPWGLNMGCNAKLAVLLEPCEGAPAWLLAAVAAERRREEIVLATSFSPAERIPRPIALVVCGEGADAAPLERLGETLGWQVRRVGKDDALEPLDDRTAAVVMTHNYARDLVLLGALLASPVRYVGVLGPRSRTERLLQDLGLPDEERLHAPVGLDLGAETPAEVALAIAAEVRAAFAGRPGGALRGRRGPIHDRR
jgi:xanthine dehydrogenase accessory factor